MKKILICFMTAAMAVSMLTTGCEKEEAQTMSVKVQEDDEAGDFVYDGLPDGDTILAFLDAPENIYVLQEDEPVDFTDAFDLDERIFGMIEADPVNTSALGEQQASFRIYVYPQRLVRAVAYMADNGLTSFYEVPDEVFENIPEEEPVPVEVTKTVEVVDEGRAEELADAGETVFTSDGTFGVEDETEPIEETLADPEEEESEEDPFQDDADDLSTGDEYVPEEKEPTTKATTRAAAERPQAQTTKKPETTKTTKKPETTRKTTKTEPTTKATTSKPTTTKPTTKEPTTQKTTQKPTTTTQAQHSHTWEAITKVVHHDAEGHNEKRQTGTRTVVDSEAWDEEKVTGEKYVCKKCGYSSSSDTAVADHIADAHDGDASYSLKRITETVHHSAVTHEEPVYENVWVQDKAAWDETVTTGYKCSGCGATK